MEEELKSLERNGTFKFVRRPNNVKVIRSTWNFRAKLDGQGNFVRAKSRLCARGDLQDAPLDSYYSPVGSSVSFRCLISLQQKMRLSAVQLDIPNSYLQSRLPMQEQIYMEVPPGWNTIFNTSYSSSTVVLLKNYLYGLKYSGKAWNATMDKLLKSVSFVPSRRDRCLYIHATRLHLCLLLYVDDIYVVGYMNDVGWIRDILKSEFQAKFEVPKFFLGIRIEMVNDEIHLSAFQGKIDEDLCKNSALAILGSSIKSLVQSSCLCTAIAHATKLGRIQTCQ
eukprot:TRINITY_DN6758_c0_g1_i4.p1 TRINITY_DN6758_c0_g1~~TRINITY_DN6758_c0_g1_i4.p1  ORF type:complete len:280 (+),score=34.90 TRINITY_DN6758_c0_g1_i4:623-1462(+)